ncbi:hypothetical protein BH10ACI2_BH10ACI2_04300 [soil metagenome]
MSLSEVFIELGEDVMPEVLEEVANGEFRVLTARIVAELDVNGASIPIVDDQGYPSPTTEEQTAQFIPCMWEIASDSMRDADEANVASQTRGVIRYRITAPQKWKGSAVEVKMADTIELKQRIEWNFDPITLLVTAPKNISNVVWEIIAVDVQSP